MGCRHGVGLWVAVKSVCVSVCEGQGPASTRYSTLTRIFLSYSNSTQRWKMSNLLHGPISTNQILPREKGVNRDVFGTSNLQNITYGVSCDE